MVTVETQIDTLISSKARLSEWIKIAQGYYHQSRGHDFQKILETAIGQKFTETYDEFDQDFMLLLDTLAAFYVQLGHRQRQPDKRKDYFAKATQMYNNADKIIMYEENHLLGRAYFLLLEGEKLAQADSQFNFVINQNPKNIKALIGKSYIYFHRKDYKNALSVLKKALRIHPQAPADVRIGMGHAFFKLGNIEKARLAYERALELQPKSCQALIGLALIELNARTARSTRKGVEYLSKAYLHNPTNPMVLNLLADHFFYKKDFEKVKKLALQAFQLAENEPMKAESSFQLARVFHSLKNFEPAYQYYYQSVQFSLPNYLTPYFGLTQMYIKRGEYENALNSLSKILKHQSNCSQALKLQAFTLKKLHGVQSLSQIISNYMTVLKICPNDLEALLGLAQATENTNYHQAIDCYVKAFDILSNNMDEQIDDGILSIAPPELLLSIVQNNIACLNFLLGKYESSLELMQLVKQRANNKNLLVISDYNIAIISEHLKMNEVAIGIYHNLLKEKNLVVPCHLRLGSIALKNEDYSEAKDQFNEAIHQDQNNLDALTLLAQLHEKNRELSVAQKIYQKILGINPKDTYALLSLGNIFLATAHHHGESERDKINRHLDGALNYYKHVLKIDNSNVYAANGIGAVFAHKGFMNEARDVFSQSKEAYNNCKHIWMNLAHAYLELRQYNSAYKMYVTGLHKFCDMTAVDVLTFMAKALFRSNELKKAFIIAQKTCIIDPSSVITRYNLASITQCYAYQVMTSEDSTVNEVISASEMLTISINIFQEIQKEASQTKSFRIDGDHLQYQINYTNELAMQAENYQKIAQDREDKRQAEIKDQIAQLEKLDREREERDRIQREKELERDQKIDEIRNRVIKKAQENIEAIKKAKQEQAAKVPSEFSEQILDNDENISDIDSEMKVTAETIPNEGTGKNDLEIIPEKRNDVELMMSDDEENVTEKIDLNPDEKDQIETHDEPVPGTAEMEESFDSQSDLSDLEKMLEKN